MTALGFVGAALGLSASLFMLWHVVRLWRGQPTRLEAVIESTPSHSTISRGYVRTFPVVSVLMVPILSVLILSIAVELEGVAFNTAVAILIGCSFLFCVLAPSVLLFNRPRFLVIPSMRDDPGLLASVMNRLRN